MDKLEKYIIENREYLDRYEPDPEIWQRIDKNSKSGSFIKVFSWAAAIVLIMGLSFISYSLIIKQTVNGRTSMNSRYGTREIREAEIFYTNKTNILLEKTRYLLTDEPELEEQVLSDISRLDSLCMEIKNDLRDNVSNQDVIEALILNYRIKVDILEEMLSVLEEKEGSNPDKKNDHEL